MCSPPAQCCELLAQCSSSLLNSLEDEEQLGSALSEGKTHGGYLKWLFYHSLRGCCEACHGLPGPAPTFSCHSLLASICMHIFSLQNCVSKITLSLMTVISFSNLLQVAELNNRSGELEDSLERISTGNFWTPHSTNTRAHSRAHTHGVYNICDCVSTCADMDENLQLLQKSYKQYLRNSTFYWAALL